uniref:Probable integrase n=1 Tax=Rhizobium loti TaxID=381 RepID=M5ALS0_RHILI|nr:probable integrase [Mesorhizobium loti NZP2037]
MRLVCPLARARTREARRTSAGARAIQGYYRSNDQLRQRLADFISAYNLGLSFKTSNAPAPMSLSRKASATHPQLFKLNPLQQMPGPNSKCPGETFHPIVSRESNACSPG